MTLDNLIAQKEEIDAKIAAAQAETKRVAIIQIGEIMAECNITPSDLGFGVPAKTPKTSALKGRVVKAKYANSIGDTWTGRGLMPRWLRKEVADGRKPEDFLI